MPKMTEEMMPADRLPEPHPEEELFIFSRERMKNNHG